MCFTASWNGASGCWHVRGWQSAAEYEYLRIHRGERLRPLPTFAAHR